MTLYRTDLEEYLKDMGYSVTIMDGKNDQNTQTEQINTFLQQGVDVLVINPVQTTSAQTIVDTVSPSGTPIVFINREPEESVLDSYKGKCCYVGADARQSGTYQGEIVLALPNKGDTNGDGVINDNDRVLSRSYTPKQTYSFGGSLDWKGFDFSFMFQGVAGNYVYNGTKQLGMNGRQDLGNLTTDVYNTWDFKPMTSKYPRLGLSDDMNGNYLKVSDIFLEKGDYLRLKNITLGYTLPKHISRHIGMEKGSVRVYLSIDNVATITGYSGTDPEVGNYGLDSGIYPTSRFFNFGVNINF